jgi:L-methionine (R)-S-oxide reductase
MQQLGTHLDAVVAEAPSVDAAARLVVEALVREVDHYSWVGIYWLEGDELVLGPWAGPQPTEHVRIPVDQGVCGLAVESDETVVVDDVSADDRYLACFASTRSEIVVPIRRADGPLIGEIDVDSDRLAAFGPSDRELLEDVAARLGRRWERGG